jgi:hypothetical protein
MKAPAVPLVGFCSNAAAHQLLAASVIRQAVLDLLDDQPTVRRSAIMFLQDSDSLIAWCAIAGLEPDVVVAYARRAITERRPPQDAPSRTSVAA